MADEFPVEEERSDVPVVRQQQYPADAVGGAGQHVPVSGLQREFPGAERGEEAEQRQVVEVCDLGACTKPRGHQRCGFDLDTLAPGDAANIAGLLGADVKPPPWPVTVPVAAFDRATAEAARYAELAHVRWEVAERLRGELAVAVERLAQERVKLEDALGIVAAEEGIDPFDAVRDLHAEVDRLRDEVVEQPGYQERHRGCVTIGGGYCVDRHDDDAPGRHRAIDGGVS